MGFWEDVVDTALDILFADEDDSSDDTDDDDADYDDDADGDFADDTERDSERETEVTEKTAFESEDFISKGVMLDGEIYILEDQDSANDDDWQDRNSVTPLFQEQCNALEGTLYPAIPPLEFNKYPAK